MSLSVTDRMKRLLGESHDLKVGDILYSDWGYDQTNIDYYQIVAITPSGVSIREISKKVVGGGGSPTEQVAPVPNDFTGPVLKKRVNPNGTVKIDSYERARKWDGKPKNRTGAAYGR